MCTLAQHVSAPFALNGTKWQASRAICNYWLVRVAVCTYCWLAVCFGALSTFALGKAAAESAECLAKDLYGRETVVQEDTEARLLEQMDV